MPLLEVVQTRQISASIRLTDTTAAQVDQYAAFIRACADDVVEQALAYVFSKDRDFQDFLKTPGSPEGRFDVADSEGSGCRGLSSSFSEASACAYCRSRIPSKKCLILHFIPGQRHYGATHRKEC